MPRRPPAARRPARPASRSPARSPTPPGHSPGSPQRPARLSRTDAAITPAVEVRSTVGPRWAPTAPASVSAAVSAGLGPPSGPTITTRSPGDGSGSELSAVPAPGSSSTARAADRTARATSGVDASVATSGNLALRACLAASRAVARQRASARSPRSPCHWVTQRCAAQGTITSTPASVISSTASGPRSPLGSACTTTTAGSAGGSIRRDLTARCSTPPPACVTTHSARLPAPSVTSARSPGARRRTVAPWRPSGPDRTITSPARPPAGARKTGGRASPPCWSRSGASRPRVSWRRVSRPCVPQPWVAARSAAVERVPQPGEEPLLAGREPARRGLLTPELGQLLEQRLLLLVELGRRLHRHVDDQVTTAGVVQVPHPQPVQRDDLAGLGARADVEVPGAVQRLHRQGRPEGGGHHRDRDRAVEIVALALEDRVRPLDDLKEQVAGRPATGADLPLARELDVRPVLDARRDPDLDGAAGAYPAVRVALGAWPPDDGAVAAAGRTRPGGHHLAEEGPGDLAYLAPAGAHVAGLGVGPGRGALARAGRADHGGVHHQLPGRPERAFGQVEIDPDGGVAAPAGAAARPPRARAGAEERVHDVAEREPGAEPARRAWPGPGPGERIGAQVVHLPLLRVGEHLVGLRDLLEPLLGLRVRVDVRVQLPGEPSVGLLDLVGARVAADAEYPVVVVHDQVPARIWPTYRATARTAPIAVG